MADFLNRTPLWMQNLLALIFSFLASVLSSGGWLSLSHLTKGVVQLAGGVVTAVHSAVVSGVDIAGTSTCAKGIVGNSEGSRVDHRFARASA